MNSGVMKHVEEILKDYPRVESDTTKHQDLKSVQCSVLDETIRMEQKRKQRDIILFVLNNCDSVTRKVIDLYYFNAEKLSIDDISLKISTELSNYTPRMCRRIISTFLEAIAKGLGWA